MSDEFGTTLEGATSGFFSYIQRVNDIGGLREALDTTVHGTTEGWETSEPSSIKKAGESTLNLLYNKNDFDKAQSALALAAETWTITTGTGGSTYVCDGYVINNTMAIPLGENVTQTVTIKWTGKPEWTP